MQVEKDKLTPELSERLIEIKEKEFGYVGLTKDISFFEGRDDSRVRRAVIEDLLIYENENAKPKENPYL